MLIQLHDSLMNSTASTANLKEMKHMLTKTQTLKSTFEGKSVGIQHYHPVLDNPPNPTKARRTESNKKHVHR